MGNEANCTVRFGKDVSAGRALLETSEILFRGEFRLKIPFASIKSAKASDGELRLQTMNGLAVFELGPTAEKWCEKILRPKTRIEKLGLKAGASILLIGRFDADFLNELKQAALFLSTGGATKNVESTFLAVDSQRDLAKVAKIAESLKGAAALWIVYPKGQKSPTENDVISAGRMAGLKDLKVVSFSPTHTALKFVHPLDKR